MSVTANELEPVDVVVEEVESTKYSKLNTRYKNLKEREMALKEENEEFAARISDLESQLYGKDVILNQISQEQMTLGQALNQKNESFKILSETFNNLLASIISGTEMSKKILEDETVKYYNQDSRARDSLLGK